MSDQFHRISDSQKLSKYSDLTLTKEDTNELIDKKNNIFEQNLQTEFSSDKK